jgi:hypothetical protein
MAQRRSGCVLYDMIGWMDPKMSLYDERSGGALRARWYACVAASLALAACSDGRQ